MNRRLDGPRVGPVFLGSVALHLAAIAVVSYGALDAKPAPPRVRVYRVDIVSPAPNQLGEPPAEAPAPAAAEPAPAEAAPEPAPEPVKAAPAPQPDPPAPEAPKQAPPREEPKRTPPTPPRETPRRTETPPRTTPTPPRETERPSTERTAGTGTRPVPATGRNPEANSPGGEGLNVRTRGVACPENYCSNVVRQVRRFFRAPEGTQGASGNVCFTLFRNGSVEDVTVERQRGGGFPFRLALVEAVEQAGLQRAFGTLPAGFDAESLQLCVQMSPATT